MFFRIVKYILTGLFTVSFLTYLFISFFGDYIIHGTDSNANQHPYLNLIEVSRPVYPLRHFKWSGIPPLFGGFLPDPHFMANPAYIAPENVHAILGVSKAKYQITEINNFFYDNTSEVLFAIELDDEQKFVIPIDVPLGSAFHNMIQGMKIPIFVGQKQLLVYLNFTNHDIKKYSETSGFGLINLPLSNKSKMNFVSFNSVDSLKILVKVGTQISLNPIWKKNICHNLSLLSEREGLDFSSVTVCSDKSLKSSGD